MPRKPLSIARTAAERCASEKPFTTEDTETEDTEKMLKHSQDVAKLRLYR